MTCAFPGLSELSSEFGIKSICRLRTETVRIKGKCVAKKPSQAAAVDASAASFSDGELIAVGTPQQVEFWKNRSIPDPSEVPVGVLT